MANSILNSDDGAVSGSAGLKFTAGDDGVLKIQNNGTDALTVSDAGVVTFAQPPLTSVPAFRAYLSTTQSITSSVITKVNIDTKTGDGFFDTNDWFDTTNKRYVPQIAGYYFLSGIVRISGTSQTQQNAYLYKNGSSYVAGTVSRQSVSAGVHVTVSSTAYMNGSTDYIELFGLIAATSPSFSFVSADITSIFEGFLVRAA